MKTVWIVTYPTHLSVAGDLYFECDGVSLSQQFMGGLVGSDIEGFYVSASSAASRADDLIRLRDAKADK